MDRERIKTVRENFSTARLCYLIKEKGAVQCQLAEFMGVTPQIVSQWKSGVRVPLWKNIRKLAEYFGVPYDSFFEEWSGNDDMGINDQTVADYLGLTLDTVQTLAAFRDFPGCAAAFHLTVENLVVNLAAAICTALKEPLSALRDSNNLARECLTTKQDSLIGTATEQEAAE